MTQGEKYRQWQKTLTKDFLIPMLNEWLVPTTKTRVLEVGCGNGGCGAVFARLECGVSAVDIEGYAIESARQLNAAEGVTTDLHVGDVCRGDFPAGQFDLILMRDVAEHLDDPKAALYHLRQRLAPGGRLLVAFPPYYSPYGGHQQLHKRRALHFPYSHLLPGTNSPEVADVRKTRLTMHKFEHLAQDLGFEVQQSRKFLIRPMHAVRYGLPAVGASVLGEIPWLRELCVSAVYYLLTRVRSFVTAQPEKQEENNA